MPQPAPWLPLGTESFGGLAEYRDYRKRHGALLAARAARDEAPIAQGGTVRLPGTCGLCLQPATFTAGTARGTNIAGGRIPIWRDQLQCDCTAALPAHHRALLQFLLATGAPEPWHHALVLGSEPGLAAALACFTGEVSTMPVPLLGAPAPLHLPEGHHLLLVPDALDRAAFPLPLLEQAAHALLPGGRALFTCRLEVSLAHSSFAASLADATLRHRIGWDILPLLRTAGFASATAHLYWSEEFGYLGSANFILAAGKT